LKRYTPTSISNGAHPFGTFSGFTAGAAITADALTPLAGHVCARTVAENTEKTKIDFIVAGSYQKRSSWTTLE
jgi:hypothetical protein